MAVKTTVELQVRVENVAWSRNLAPPGYPNRTTFCGSLCVVKETEDFEKNFVTPEFMLDLPCSSRLVVWLVSLEIEEADEPILRYKGLIRIVKHDGPNLKKLSTHLRNWVKFHSSGTKPKTVKTWISNMLYEIRHTSTDALTDVETHDELPITKRRSLWASLDWSTLPRPLRLYADGAWLASETLIELVGVCSSQRSAVLPIYWEQRCTDDSVRFLVARSCHCRATVGVYKLESCFPSQSCQKARGLSNALRKEPFGQTSISLDLEALERPMVFLKHL
jgi:hypothetical protein